MKKLELQLEPLTCPSCIKKIEGTLGKMEGVEGSKVLFNSNKVKLVFDETIVQIEDLENAIVKLGYEVF